MIDPHEVRAMRHLWRAVLVENIRAASGIQLPESYGRQDLETARARDCVGSRDFHQVCALADVAPRLDRLEAFLARPDASAAMRTARRVV